MPYEDTRLEVAVGCHLLADFGLSAGVRASLGHVSVRDAQDPTKFVIKGRGYKMDSIARMRPEDLVVCDLDANLVESPANIIPVFEVKIHSCIYKARPDVQSVVHVHPKYTVLMSVLSSVIRPMCNEGNFLVLDPLPVYPKQKIITTDEEGTEVARLLGSGKAELLFGHGAVTAGRNMQESITDMIHLEHQAEMNYLAYSVAGKDHPYVPREMVLEFNQTSGSHMDLPHFKQAVSKAGMPKPGGGLWPVWYEQGLSEI